MLYIASDHAGLNLKEKIKVFLNEQGIKYKDLGTHSTESVDASDYAVNMAKQIKNKPHDKGVLICGSGIMMSIVANRFPWVRAALAWTPAIAKQAREHNNANVLVLSGRESSPKNWKEIIVIFLDTKPLTLAKYKKRLQKLNKIK
ncbi:MAG: RpiB/LacA/LacB family sugar-phosphate isomerase [Patescibacteria group bacterium]